MGLLETLSTFHRKILLTEKKDLPVEAQVEVRLRLQWVCATRGFLHLS
jgi:hypothetical protein